MRRVLWLSLGSGVIVAALLTLYRHPADLRETRSNAEASQASTPSAPAVSALLNEKEGDSHPQISLRNQSKNDAVNEWLKRIQQDRHAQWKTPIAFYGKVTDQDDKPVADADVRLGWTDLSPSGSSDRVLKSGNDGTFSLTGVKGKRLTVSVAKAGYDVAPEHKIRSFEFSNPGEEIFYEPNSAEPVIFQLRRKQLAEPLVKKSGKLMVPVEGQAQNLYLNNGKTSDSYIRVQTWKPWPPRMSFPRYDWRIRLTMVNGGFVEAREEMPVTAPEGSYAPSYEIDMPSTSAVWNTGVERTLYFAYGEPKKYGRLNFRTNANSRYAFFEYVLNPSGSRNLEFDPAKQIKAK